MKSHRVLVSCIFLLYFSSVTSGQVSPPGMCKVNTAQWAAIGIKQDMYKDKKITSLTYFGMGNTSNPSNNNPVYRKAIYVLNQEFFKQINYRNQYSIAASYRWQNRYKETSPFEKDNPEAIQEIRFYGRYAYSVPKGRLVFSMTFRPEARMFYTPGFQPYSEKFEIRTRLKGKVSLDIGKQKIHKIIASLEMLFSKSKSYYWNKFDYGESRLCLYYSLSPKKSGITFNIGYMNNLIGKSFEKSVHYFALDVVFKNIFGRNRKGY